MTEEAPPDDGDVADVADIAEPVDVADDDDTVPAEDDAPVDTCPADEAPAPEDAVITWLWACVPLPDSAPCADVPVPVLEDAPPDEACAPVEEGPGMEPPADMDVPEEVPCPDDDEAATCPEEEDAVRGRHVPSTQTSTTRQSELLLQASSPEGWAVGHAVAINAASVVDSQVDVERRRKGRIT